MNTVKDYLYKLIEKTPTEELPDIIDFVIDKNRKSDEKRFKDVERASNSSTDFWDNDIDDKVWNEANTS